MASPIDRLLSRITVSDRLRRIEDERPRFHKTIDDGLVAFFLCSVGLQPLEAVELITQELIRIGFQCDYAERFDAYLSHGGTKVSVEADPNPEAWASNGNEEGPRWESIPAGRIVMTISVSRTSKPS